MILKNVSNEPRRVQDFQGESLVVKPGEEFSGPDNYMATFLRYKGWERVDVEEAPATPATPATPTPPVAETTSEDTIIDAALAEDYPEHEIVERTDEQIVLMPKEGGTPPVDIDLSTLDDRSFEELKDLAKKLEVNPGRSKKSAIAAITAFVNSK